MFNTGINFIEDGTLTIKLKLSFSVNGVNANLLVIIVCCFISLICAAVCITFILKANKNKF